MTRVVALGIAVLDRLFEVAAIPASPVKVTARRWRETGGGIAATAAVAIAALGGEAAYWGRLGDDDAGRWLAAELARRGVDLAGLRIVPGGRSPVAAALVDPAGERLLAVFTGEGLGRDPSCLPFDRLAGVAAVLADLRWAEGAAALFAEAGRRGIPRVLDADSGEKAALAELVGVADHVVFSAAGLAEFAGIDAREKALREAARRSRGLVGVTAGAEGFYWLADGEIRHAPGFAVAARDTTGAGDVFHGAYALALAEGRDVAAAARFANAAAALKCQAGEGWAGMPGREAVERLMSEGRDGADAR